MSKKLKLYYQYWCIIVNICSSLVEYNLVTFCTSLKNNLLKWVKTQNPGIWNWSSNCLIMHVMVLELYCLRSCTRGTYKCYNKQKMTQPLSSYHLKASTCSKEVLVLWIFWVCIGSNLGWVEVKQSLVFTVISIAEWGQEFSSQGLSFALVIQVLLQLLPIPIGLIFWAHLDFSENPNT